MSEVDKLLDELERQSELIAALRVEIATKDKRIKELEASHADMAHDQLEIAKLLNGYGIEHSGFKRQAPRVEMLIERARLHARQRIEEIKKRKTEEAPPDGRTYAGGAGHD